MQTKKSTYTSLLAFFAVLVVVNLLAIRFFFRIDLTEDKRYTLSNATKDILQDLEDPVTVTVYFTKDIPQEVASVRNEFQDLLIEFASRSRGMVAYEFIDPNKDTETERRAQEAGIQPIMITKNEKDQQVQQRAYLGAVVSMGEAKEIIPIIQSGSAMEYSLSTSIKKMAVMEKPAIAFIQGHGEPRRTEFAQAIQNLSVLYRVDFIELNDTISLLPYKAIAWVNPADSIPENHFIKLDEYLKTGGKLMVSLNRVNFDQQQNRGFAANTGLETWLEEKGILVSPEFITDSRCGSVTVPQRVGNMQFNTQLSFPYFPIISKYADHPISSGLGPIALQFASPVSYVGDEQDAFTPLAFTSEQSGSVNVPMFLNLEKQWKESDFPDKYIPVAGLIKTSNYQMIVVGDGDFSLNGSGQNQRRIGDDNVRFFVNSLDFLSDDTGLIELRNKGITPRLIEEVDDSKRITLKWANFLIPLILTLIIGLYRMQRNRSIRNKRREGSYV